MERELEVAKNLAKRAGIMLLEKRRKISKISIKKDESPVCNVDQEISKFLTRELLAEFPNYGILDEEDPNDLRHKHKYCWVTDPLDGTSEYLNGGNDFGVMIGLMENFHPILGVIYKPLTNEFIYASKGEGAFLENEGAIKLNVSHSKILDVVTTKHRSNNELNDILNSLHPSSIRKMPSSFKTIEVAKGSFSAFICPKSITMNLWDLCAPQAILEEAGGKVTDLQGESINYEGDLVNKRGVIASNGVVQDIILSKLGVN